MSDAFIGHLGIVLAVSFFLYYSFWMFGLVNLFVDGSLSCQLIITCLASFILIVNRFVLTKVLALQIPAVLLVLAISFIGFFISIVFMTAAD